MCVVGHCSGDHRLQLSWNFLDLETIDPMSHMGVASVCLEFLIVKNHLFVSPV